MKSLRISDRAKGGGQRGRPKECKLSHPLVYHTNKGKMGGGYVAIVPSGYTTANNIQWLVHNKKGLVHKTYIYFRVKTTYGKTGQAGLR